IADSHYILFVNKDRVALFITLLNGDRGDQSRKIVFGLFIHYHSSLLSSASFSESSVSCSSRSGFISLRTICSILSVSSGSDSRNSIALSVPCPIGSPPYRYQLPRFSMISYSTAISRISAIREMPLPY